METDIPVSILTTAWGGFRGGWTNQELGGRGLGRGSDIRGLEI